MVSVAGGTITVLICQNKYVVAKIGNDNSNNGASFRLFDENSYWSGAAEYEVKNSKQVVVDLNNMYKSCLLYTSPSPRDA